MFPSFGWIASKSVHARTGKCDQATSQTVYAGWRGAGETEREFCRTLQLGIDEIVATAQSVRSYSGVLFSKEIGRLR